MRCTTIGDETCACERCRRMDRRERAERQVAAVRNALAALECAAGTTSYRMSEPEAFTDGRREGYRLAAEHIHEALETP